MASVSLDRSTQNLRHVMIYPRWPLLALDRSMQNLKHVMYDLSKMASVSLDRSTQNLRHVMIYPRWPLLDYIELHIFKTCYDIE